MGANGKSAVPIRTKDQSAASHTRGNVDVETNLEVENEVTAPNLKSYGIAG